MASIQKITEFKAGRETLGDIHYTVYYDSGRRVNYYGRDTLPMTVVNLLTDENTVSETVYIDDNYLHCVNSRTTYTPADKPQEAAPADDPEAVTLAPAEDAQVWDENGETVTPDTDTEEEEEEKTVEKIKVVYEKKEGRTYTETWRSEKPEEVYERLAHCLIAKKLNNCGWIRSIKRVPLYNGFDRITVTHDNGGRDVYTVASH